MFAVDEGTHAPARDPGDPSPMPPCQTEIWRSSNGVREAGCSSVWVSRTPGRRRIDLVEEEKARRSGIFGSCRISWRRAPCARQPHRRHDRLRGRGEVALRDVVVLRLALRHVGGDEPARVLRPVRPAPGDQDRHPSLRRHDPILRRSRRRRPRRARQPHLERGLFQGAEVGSSGRISTISASSTPTPRCSAASTAFPAGSRSSAPTGSCSPPTLRSVRSKPTIPRVIDRLGLKQKRIDAKCM